MNIRRFTLTLLALLLCSGCASPVWMEQSSAEIAQSLGLPTEAIRSVKFCSFGVVNPGERRLDTSGSFGAFVMTDSNIYLLSGARDRTAKELKRTIPINAIRGVGDRRFGAGAQL